MSEFIPDMYYDFSNDKCVVHQKLLNKWKNIAKEKKNGLNKIIKNVYFEFDFIFPSKLTDKDLDLSADEMDSIYDLIRQDLASLGCKNIEYYAY